VKYGVLLMDFIPAHCLYNEESGEIIRVVKTTAVQYLVVLGPKDK
jgi:hypothetical protein